MSPRASRLGLTSVLLALSTWFAGILLVVLWFAVENESVAQQRVQTSLLVFALMVAPLLHVTGLVLGFMGAFKSPSLRFIPITGIVLHAVGLALAAIGWLVALALGALKLGAGAWR